MEELICEFWDLKNGHNFSESDAGVRQPLFLLPFHEVKVEAACQALQEVAGRDFSSISSLFYPSFVCLFGLIAVN